MTLERKVNPKDISDPAIPQEPQETSGAYKIVKFGNEEINILDSEYTYGPEFRKSLGIEENH